MNKYPYYILEKLDASQQKGLSKYLSRSGIDNNPEIVGYLACNFSEFDECNRDTTEVWAFLRKECEKKYGADIQMFGAISGDYTSVPHDIMLDRIDAMGPGASETFDAILFKYKSAK